MCTVLAQTLSSNSERGVRNSSRLANISPIRLSATPTYSYLAEYATLKRPIEPYDRKKSHPNMHFHIPDDKGSRSYLNSLYGRSRSGMKVLIDTLRHSTPRVRSPAMSNEEPIELAHYPDGKRREEERLAPIERDDFPAPPFAYSDPYRRRRHWSEPEMKDSGELSSFSSSTESLIPESLLKQEETLRKIHSGLGTVFLNELAIEKEKRRHRYVDPRSAARVPSANKEPLFRLRYDSPCNASPSRIADHVRPWDEEARRSVITPFLPNSFSQVKSSTLPSQFSPYAFDSSEPLKTYSTDFSSKSDDYSSGDVNFGEEEIPPSFSTNVYPLHLLSVNNYRLPGDVDRCNLEKHLSDTDFDALFKVSRSEFYGLPYWKRCELKRKFQLF